MRRMTKADLARAAVVSRAAVSKWFRNHSPEGRVNVESRTLMNLAHGLGITPERLLRPTIDLTPWEPFFLWDRLYDSMPGFVGALVRGEPVAIARLVQVAGFYDARRVVGKKVTRLFDRYKHFIKPARRRQLEILWPLYNSPI